MSLKVFCCCRQCHCDLMKLYHFATPAGVPLSDFIPCLWQKIQFAIFQLAVQLRTKECFVCQCPGPWGFKLVQRPNESDEDLRKRHVQMVPLSNSGQRCQCSATEVEVWLIVRFVFINNTTNRWLLFETFSWNWNILFGHGLDPWHCNFGLWLATTWGAAQKPGWIAHFGVVARWDQTLLCIEWSLDCKTKHWWLDGSDSDLTWSLKLKDWQLQVPSSKFQERDKQSSNIMLHLYSCQFNCSVLRTVNHFAKPCQGRVENLGT